ncbi:hypothetical protein GJ744_008999 [Endocarpon pusillum]|uniref:Uncharacterized protein n=1 Tax=Endocarpon pusillum TaxID=364733 RepID=A0A8H7E470_9EURO|nr:hypothetical protein GJ744_008999 [Endocarpon pusillum]
MYRRHHAALVGRWKPSLLKPSQLQSHIKPPSLPSLARNFHSPKLAQFMGLFATQTGTDYASYTLTFIHDYSGLPWGLSIPITAILIRSLFALPTYYAILLNQRKMDMGEPLREAYQNAWTRKIQDAARHAGENAPSEVKAMSLGGNSKVTMLFSKQLKYNPYVAMLPVLYWPVWASCVYVLMGMSGWGDSSPEKVAAYPVPTDPSLASEGLLWFPNLTAFDPFLCTVFFGLLISNAASAGFQGLRLRGTFSTAHGWPRFKYRLYTTPSIVISALFGICFLGAEVPAVLALFCVSSSACALVQRGLMRRLIRQSTNTIMPAHPREMKMRRGAATDAHGIRSYGQTVLVPKEFDHLFQRTQTTLNSHKAPLASDPAQSIAQKPSHRVRAERE